MSQAERSFRVFVQKLNDDAAKTLVTAAREGERKTLADQAGRRGIVPGIIKVVDGQRRPDYGVVKPTSQIVQLFDYRAEAIYALLRELAARSPSRSGKYRRSHTVYLDGVALKPMVIPSSAQLAKVTRIMVTNPVPYAARLEVGKTKSGRPFVIQVAPRIYEGALRVLQREFRNVASLSYRFTRLPNPYIRRGGISRSKRRRAGTAIEYPAILIEAV